MGLTGGVVALGAPPLAPLIAPKYVDAAETRVIAGAAVGRLLPRVQRARVAPNPGSVESFVVGMERCIPVRTVGRPG